MDFVNFKQMKSYIFAKKTETTGNEKLCYTRCYDCVCGCGIGK